MDGRRPDTASRRWDAPSRVAHVSSCHRRQCSTCGGPDTAHWRWRASPRCLQRGGRPRGAVLTRGRHPMAGDTRRAAARHCQQAVGRAVAGSMRAPTDIDERRIRHHQRAMVDAAAVALPECQPKKKEDARIQRRGRIKATSALNAPDTAIPRLTRMREFCALRDARLTR